MPIDRDECLVSLSCEPEALAVLHARPPGLRHSVHLMACHLTPEAPGEALIEKDGNCRLDPRVRPRERRWPARGLQTETHPETCPGCRPPQGTRTGSAPEPACRRKPESPQESPDRPESTR